jgi:hypothetical protein
LWKRMGRWKMCMWKKHRCLAVGRRPLCNVRKGINVRQQLWAVIWDRIGAKLLLVV